VTDPGTAGRPYVCHMAVAGLVVGILALALSGVSLIVGVRRWRHDEFLASRESTPMAVLAFVDQSWWWRLSNHGPRFIRPVMIEWCDVEPAEAAVDPAGVPWGIPPGGHVFVPAIGSPRAGRRMALTFSIVVFRPWQRRGGTPVQRTHFGAATIDPTY
jgi:hypothetical protein